MTPATTYFAIAIGILVFSEVAVRVMDIFYYRWRKKHGGGS
jgi:hypothetical protein